jgi:peptide/nickel transport system substrate-binding protein
MVLAVMVLMLAGCQQERSATVDEATDQPVDGGTAVVALADEPDVLNSLVRTSAVAGTVLSLLQDALAEMGPDLQWSPQIAAGWTVAPDSLSITYVLRPWRWEDGQPLVAEDVRLSCELLRDPVIGSPRADLLRAVASCEALDDARVRYTFTTPQADPVQATFHSILPAHRVASLDRTAVASWPINRAPLASGPFRLIEWQPGRQLVLGRNPSYPLAPPRLDRVILRVIPDETARILALETGEVDFVNDIPAATARRLQDHARIQLREVTGRVFGFVMWNARRAALADATTRRALSLAIDRSRFIEDLLGGFGEPAASYLPPVLWNHHPGLPADRYRPAEARAALAAAGWSDDDGDGILDRDGRRLALEVIYRGGDAQRDNAAALLRQNLQQVGVAVSLRGLELATALDFLRQGRFDAYLGEFRANLIGDPSPLVSSGATDRFNYGGYANARVDSLLAVALAEPDRQRARPIWFALQEELAADPPAAMLYYRRQVIAVNRRLRNVEPNVLGPLDNIQAWWIAPADRRWAAAPDEQ